MNFVQTYAKEIFALLVPFIQWALNSSQRSKAKLIMGIRHSHTFLVDQPRRDVDGTLLSPTQTVNTASVMIHNGGKKTANNVQIVFNWEPMCINNWPNRDYEEKTLPDGRYVRTFNTLSPKEFVGFEILAVNAQLPELVNVRCDECVAVKVPMAPQQLLPPWKIKIAQALMMVGMAASAYLLILLVQFLVLLTPLGVGR